MRCLGSLMYYLRINPFFWKISMAVFLQYKKKQKYLSGKSKYFNWIESSYLVVIETLTQIAVVIIITINPCVAQITPDGTLGKENSRVTPNISVKGSTADLIEGGAQRGSNLFHSFLEFNVNNGQRVYFGNPTGIENIFTRVTGNNPSNILGTLGVNGNANLFLLNPNGIVFGPNAQLDIQGSFFATTANSFKFSGGGEFSATNPQAPPLLTMSVPVGVQYGANPGSITNQSVAVDASNNSVGLQVLSGNTLALVGGNVSLDGGILTAPGGRVELGGLAAPGTVGLQVNGNNLAISFPDSVNRADVFLTKRASVNVQSGALGNSGDINVQAGSLSLSDGAQLQASTFGQGNSGSVIIHATKSVSLDGHSTAIFSSVGEVNYPQNNVVKGNGGNIGITTDQLLFTNGAGLVTNTFGQGNSGSLVINAIQLSLTSGAQLEANTFGQGNAGSVIINATKSVSLDGDNTTIFSNVGDGNYLQNNVVKGNGGNIGITTDQLLLTNGAGLVTNTFGQGNAGSVVIHVTQLSLTNGAQLQAGTFGEGNVGNVIINATKSVSLDGNHTAIFSSVGDVNYLQNNVVKGNGGNIGITTDQLSLTNGAGLVADTFGQGNAGSVIIHAQQGSVDVQQGGQINSSVENGGTGNGGDVKISTDALTLDNASIIANANSGNGKGGTIEINTRNLLLGNNSNISTTVAGNVRGGSIQISTGSLLINNQSRLDTSTSGTGDAGSVTINAPQGLVDVQQEGQINSSVENGGTGNGGDVTIKTDTLTLDNASIVAQTANGKGGTIGINTGNLLLRNNSWISATAGSTNHPGSGGIININAKDGFVIAVPSENSDITANAFGGSGGRITITANRVLGFQYRGKLSTSDIIGLRNNHTSDISASSDVGQQGQVSLNTLSIDPSQGLVALPTNLVDVTGLIAQGCGAGNSGAAKGQSEFVITGRGGLPLSPDDPLSAGAVSSSWVNRDANKFSDNTVKTTVKEANVMEFASGAAMPLVDAVGMVRNSNGDIVLTAQSATATQLQSGLSSKLCGVGYSDTQ